MNKGNFYLKPKDIFCFSYQFSEVEEHITQLISTFIIKKTHDVVNFLPTLLLKL